MARFWIAELDGATVAIPDAAATSRKRRTIWYRWRRLHILLKVASVAVFAASIFGGLVAWRALTRERDLRGYDVVFEGPVIVEEGSDVRFNGVRVGQVRTIRLDRLDPNRVIARIAIDPATPVRVDSFAQVQSDRRTSAIFVQIFAGSPDKPLLLSKIGEAPQITVQRTVQDELEQGQQDLLTVQGDFYSRATKFFDLLEEEHETKKAAEAKSAAPVAGTEKN